MASLITSLAVSGSRKSDGTANASGKVFLYSPGTTTLVLGYKDDQLSEAWTTSGGGIALGASGKVKIWVNDPVDVVVTDSSGTTVDTFLGFNKVRAEQVEVENASYTGAITDDATGEVTQGLGGKTDQDTILTSIATSLGGPDGKYLESAGATARPYVEVITGLRISVKDFGARGNNIADDSVAIQAALDEAKRLGATLIFEQGTYLHSQVLTLASATGVRIEGRGVAALYSTSTTLGNLVLSSCAGCSIKDLTIAAQASSTGTQLSISSGNTIVLDNVGTNNSQINIDITGSFINLNNCFSTVAVGAAGRAIRCAATDVCIVGGEVIAGSGAAIEFTGAAARTAVMGVSFGSGSSPTGILFNASLTGTRFKVIGCPGLGDCTTPIDVTGVTIDPRLHQYGNNAERASFSGTPMTPIVVGHNEIHLTGAAGATTVNAPAVLPSASEQGKYWDFVFVNDGAGTTWTTNAIYVLSGAVAVPATASHIIQVRFRWDPTSSKFRECSRGDTV